MQEIYLIRHTKTEVTAGTCYGQSDVDVGGDFFEVAETVKTKIPDVHEIDYFYSSPLKRCTKLAEILCADNKNIITDDRIMELNFGSWEMKQWNDLSKEDMDSWCMEYDDKAIHGGETFNQLIARSLYFWNDKILSTPQKSIVVCHAGVIRALVTHVLEIPKRNAFSIFLEYGQVIQVCIYSKENFRVRFL